MQVCPALKNLPHANHLAALEIFASGPTMTGDLPPSSSVTEASVLAAAAITIRPTAGLPFHFQEWREFENFVGDQKKTGIIDHMNEIRWDIRPSPHLGTIEVRIFDGVSNLHELSALVALTHCLIVDLDRRFDAGESLPVMPPWHVQENKWRAARYGLDAIIILDADSNERLVTEDLDDILERLVPVAKSLGCVDELARVADVYRTGASYQRQRRIAEEHDGDLRTVVDALVGELVI